MKYTKIFMKYVKCALLKDIVLANKYDEAK